MTTRLDETRRIYEQAKLTCNIQTCSIPVDSGRKNMLQQRNCALDKTDTKQRGLMDSFYYLRLRINLRKRPFIILSLLLTANNLKNSNIKVY